MPVRRRDDRAAGGDAEAERTGGDLLELAVRRYKNVGRSEQVTDLLDREEAIVELDVIFEAEIHDGVFERQAVPLAFTLRHIRVRPAGDDVEHLRVGLDDRRQRFDDGLEALARRDQSERRKDEAVLRTRVPAP